ncbi:MAG: molybdopterin molybdotransferase MoeA [Planctomycetes bacterium]|nr:molybdopterin molybdotransferase MoeA [Planctomycetota bacterium]
MRSPDEAVSTILERAGAGLGSEHAPLAEACGRVLAADVRSDLDLPPFPKSAMDGYAVHRDDLASGTARLRVVGEVRAGAPFEGAVPRGACVAIYTGGALPADLDAVVMVEKSRAEGDAVVLTDAPAARQHVCEQGEDLRRGELVLAAGRRLVPGDLSLLASVGCEPVPVARRPRVAIVTTGDELVPPTAVPGPGQIREGNTLHLAALARAAGADVRRAGIVRDDERDLAASFAALLDEVDVLVTTGGVSMGKYDLVGAALEACGVEPIFHKVAIKPGKPVWFGARGAQLVFGLPGNPVSCLVGMQVFVAPALRKLGGEPAERWVPAPRRARWGGAATRPGDREQYLPVRAVQAPDGVDELEAVRWKSSADLVGLARADGFAVIAPGETLAPGDPVRYRPLD